MPMPAKLKPLRKDEDMARVPTSDPILVELEPASRGDDDNDADAPVIEQQRAAPVQETEEDDDASPQVKSLNEQLVAMKAANAAADERAAKADREKADALRLANERAEEVKRATQERDLSERDLISNALSSAKQRSESAKAACANAFAQGDGVAAANAQEQLSRAQAEILTYETSQADLASRAEEAKEPKPQAQQVQPTFEQSIDQNPNLLPKEKEWLRAHPEMIMDGSRDAELGVGYQRAVRQGLIRGTEAYFNFLDEFMGYKTPAKTEERTDDNNGRNSIMAAPVTRQAPSNGNSQVNGNQVYLSPDQRAMARSMGLSDRDYASQVVRLEQAKRDDPERYPSRR